MIDQTDRPHSHIGAAPASTKPRVSVVITWPHEADRLGEILRRRLPQRERSDFDMIVVTTTRAADDVAESCPDIRFITAAADSSVGRMRTLGVQNAMGNIVMLIDNLFDDDLVDAVFSLRTADGEAVGHGAVAPPREPPGPTPASGEHTGTVA